ncbi:asparagine synthase [Macrophomina phaseolina]|uniref:Asparagine synthase n=1 Tax=Macrophomina phaseolina TaxID=35725 RepID=A0ABQ8FP62_9PEZI|nr:asparagine synthase [Macrophomina phaseolina]
MCGITCIIHQDDPSHVDLQKLESSVDASLNKIKHRGPDARGQWISPDKRIALGHVRLAINDLAPTGNQPFHDHDADIHAVVNGELYDYDAIRADLAGKTSYQFVGQSDCEVVIALYRHYGLSFLSHLRGEFALCLYDGRNQLFVAARDRYGIKPLFWTSDRSPDGVGRMLVAAEAKAFLPLGWRPEWDVRSLRENGFFGGDRTHFKGVSVIRPGHYMLVRSGQHVESRPYWDAEFPNKIIPETRGVEEMVQGVRERLLEAVRIRLRADVPVGIYLSGGIDSSAIAGMITHLVRERGVQLGNDNETDSISCFSIAFDENSGFDESEIAKRTADWLGIKCIKRHVGEDDFATHFEDATYHCEQQHWGLSYIGKYLLSQVAREQGTKVVLTGEGSDEHFAGYMPLTLDAISEPDLAWPSDRNPEDEKDRHAEATRRKASHSALLGMQEGKSVASRGARMLNHIPSSKAFGLPGSDAFSPWTSCYGDCNPLDNLAYEFDGCARDRIKSKWHSLHSGLYLCQKALLPSILLTNLGDRTEMAHSLEARTPFLDHHLTEYVNGLPPSLKIKWDSSSKSFIEKWVLREAMKPFITDEMYRRTKHPYSAPRAFSVGGPMHKLLSRLITKETIEKLGFVEWPQVEIKWQKAFHQQDDLVMNELFVLAQWVVISQRFGVKTAKPT